MNKIPLIACQHALSVALANADVIKMFDMADKNENYTAKLIRSVYQGFDNDMKVHKFEILFDWKKIGTEKVYDLIVPVYADVNWQFRVFQPSWVTSPD